MRKGSTVVRVLLVVAAFARPEARAATGEVGRAIQQPIGDTNDGAGLAAGSDAGAMVGTLVRDIDTTSYAASSSPGDLIRVPQGLAFTAFNRHELWIRDDREGTTQPILRSAEIRPVGPSIYAVRESGAYSLYGFTFFRLGAILSKVAGGPFVAVGASQQPLTGSPSNGSLVEADDGTGRALWLVRQEATKILRPLPLGGGRLARNVTSVGALLMFVARSTARGEAVWAADESGAREVFPQDNTTAGGLSIAGVLGTKALIVVSGERTCENAGLWTSNGTIEGTSSIFAVAAAGGCGRVLDAQVHLNRAFFVVEDDTHAQQLWMTDGTASGTLALTEFSSRAAFAGAPLRDVTWGGGFLFFADDGTHGREPWISDGTVAGTQLLRDLCPGSCSTTGQPLERLLTAREHILFSAETARFGRELWISDGTTKGTRLLIDACPGRCNGDPDDVQPSESSGHNFFTAIGPNGARAKWLTDGTPLGTHRLTPRGVDVIGGQSLGAVFVATDRAFGEELWRSGGSTATTAMWIDLGREVDSGSHPRALGEAGGRFVFSAFDTEHGRSLWSSNGRRSGTVRLDWPRPSSFDYMTSASAGGKVFLVGGARDGTVRAIWATDGNSGGTVRLTGADVDVQGEPRAVGGRVFFTAFDASHGTELWVSAGSPATTGMVADLTDGPASSELAIPSAATLDGKLLFSKSDEGGVHVWVSDGTSIGTKPLVVDYPYLQPLDAAAPVVVEEMGSHIYFGGATTDNARQLFVSDRTGAGTHPLLSRNLGLDLLLRSGDRLYAVLTGGASEEFAQEFWVSDGTAEGSARLPFELQYGAEALQPVRMNGRGLLFQSSDGKLVYSDGTAPGTDLVRGRTGQPVSAFDIVAVELDGSVLLGGRFSPAPCRAWTPGTPVEELGVAALCGGEMARAVHRIFVDGYTDAGGSELWAFTTRSAERRNAE